MGMFNKHAHALDGFFKATDGEEVERGEGPAMIDHADTRRGDGTTTADQDECQYRCRDC
jgi:hypothetical protein